MPGAWDAAVAQAVTATLAAMNGKGKGKGGGMRPGKGPGYLATPEQARAAGHSNPADSQTKGRKKLKKITGTNAAQDGQP